MKRIGTYHGIPVYEDENVPEHQLIIIKPRKPEEIPVFESRQITGLSKNNEYEIVTDYSWNDDIFIRVYLKDDHK